MANSQIMVGDSLALRSLTSNYTFTVWANFASLPSRDMCFLSKSFGISWQRKWMFWRHVNPPLGVGIHINNGGYLFYSADYPLVTNRWYMITFVSSGANCLIAVDGVVVSAQAGDLILPDTSGVSLSIGGAEPSGDQWFDGLLDDVRIYNRALSEIEIQQLARDADGDGVPDESDQCPNTPAGEVVNADGCSISQLVPASWGWKNHGEYVSAVAGVADEFMAQGLISGAQRGAIISAAGRSDVGKPR